MAFLYKNTLPHLAHLKHRGDADVLCHIRHGIEKEGLRVTPDGTLAQTAHPEPLGSALTNAYITTDYSEALLEFITPVFTHISDTLGFLDELHRYTLQCMGNDVIWANSMPVRLEGDESIPVACYGSSNIGRMKHIYRQGLAYRYGKSMQTIAGIHYNFSLPNQLWQILGESNYDVSDGYFGLIRNFNRYSWLLMYLFGASPAIDRSFLPPEHQTALEYLSDDTLYLPWATSLRMSDIGYTNKVQDKLNICYNGLDEYIHSLSRAIQTPYAPYEAIGVKKKGKYRQLNTNILQIENEYYSTIRPKRVANMGEKPLEALKRRGVEYIEVRCLDINPLESLGIDHVTAYFTDIFLVFCALHYSPEIIEEEFEAIRVNFQTTVQEGRKPGVTLYHLDSITSGDKLKTVPLVEYGAVLIESMMPIAELLDCVNKTTNYRKSLKMQQKKIFNHSLTPSAQVLQKIRENDNSFITSMLFLSRSHRQQLLSRPLNEDRIRYFHQLAEQSHIDQKKIEQEETRNFDTFLNNYFSS